MQAFEERAVQPIEVAQYDAAQSRFFEVDASDTQAVMGLSNIPKGAVCWVNIDAQCPKETLLTLGTAFSIHPLVLENMPNSNQRTKIEEYENQIHLVAKMIYFAQDELMVEHMNFILGPNYVLSFGQVDGDVFAPTRSRIKNGGTQLRARGADYLLYTLFDSIVDGYFEALETINDRIDLLEEEVIEGASKKQLEAIRGIRRQLLSLTKAIWPLRDVASLMGKDASLLIHEETKPYLRDVYDHIVQAIDTTDTSRELVAGLAEMHFSNTSYKLNEIMKILTIISTIFMPLSFIASVYGMNFDYMPSLHYRWGYYGTWGAMLIISALMIVYFKRKKWF